MTTTTQRAPLHTPQASPRPSWWAELIDGSGIAPDVAAANVAAFGPGTDRHWESERAELIHHRRLAIQTASTTAKGLPQAQPGHLADALIRLQRRYAHLAAGGWRTTTAALPGLPAFDQWKPNAPRQKGKRSTTGRWQPQHDEQGRALAQKYESPPAFPDGGGALLPNIPERCWRLICQRQGLPFPDQTTRAAGFWPWAIATPALELLPTEGLKKALAAISCGYAAIGLPGVTMGHRRGPDGVARLIAELQALARHGRPWLIAFDAEAKPTTARKVAAAAGALARTLRAAGGQVAIARLPLLPGTTKTGIDDLLVARGPEALEHALADTLPRAALPRRLDSWDLAIPEGQWLKPEQIPSPEIAPLVVIEGPMGAGKTTAVGRYMAPRQSTGTPVVLPTHRTVLGEAVAREHGIPWEPTSGSDARREGAGFCIDSCRPSSGLQITPSTFSGAISPLDELGQLLDHLIYSRGTAVKDHRAETMETFGSGTAATLQVIASEATIPAAAVELVERLTGRRAYRIKLNHQPMAGRKVIAPRGLTPATAAEAFRATLARLYAEGKRPFVWTGAQQAESRNCPQNLQAEYLQAHPDAPTLAVDSTLHDPAEQLANDPAGTCNGLAAAFVSPVVTSGLSIPAGPFDAVVMLASGTQAVEAVAQAAARVRDPNCPVYLFAPEKALPGHLEIGSGDTDPRQLLRNLSDHESVVLRDLIAGNHDPTANDPAPFLTYWLERSTLRNRQTHAYCASILGMLQADGWQVAEPDALTTADKAAAARMTERLDTIATAALEQERQQERQAPCPTPEQAEQLERRRHLTPQERAQLARFHLGERWGLSPADTPSPAIQDADAERLSQRLRRCWQLTTRQGRELSARADAATAEAIAYRGKCWAPDLVDRNHSSRLAALDALGMPRWLERSRWWIHCPGTDAADQQLVALQAFAEAHRGALRQVLRLTPAKTAIGTLKRLLHLLGHQLESERIRSGPHRGAYRYRITRQALPPGVDQKRLEIAWIAQLDSVLRGRRGPKNPL